MLLAAALAGAVDEPMIVPVNGQFHVEGRGFGHGRGMSQWGAQGAALQGVGHRRILATYYPGTQLVKGDRKRRIRVLVTADQDGDLRVAPESGLTASRGGRKLLLPQRLDGRPVTAWRVRLEKGQLELSGRAGTWRKVRVGDPTLTYKPVILRTVPPNGVRLVLPKQQRDYRGDLRAYRDPISGRLVTVNSVRMENYLRSVVPGESFSTWRPEALRAQSIAARTYAMWRTRNAPLAGGTADVCDTTACQVYHGRQRLNLAGQVTKYWEAASTDAAIKATAGQYLRYAGAPALTEFSSSNGGWSTAGDKPYLVARPDPWDGIAPSRAHAWTRTLDVASLSRAFPKTGHVIGLIVRRRDGNGIWGGRVTSVRVVGERGSQTMTGHTFAKAVGLRHSWWQVRILPLPTLSPSPTPTPSSLPVFRGVPQERVAPR
ncbi:MAG: SpoIID/LytB domain-containing protein [Sporichthyaceae bacterium]